jgi:hypothetical protein
MGGYFIKQIMEQIEEDNMHFTITSPNKKANKELKKLPMSGANLKGDLFEVTEDYLLKNQDPVLPTMGEFHFSRWDPHEWEISLLKMKAGGIQIVATYVFWIHHEEREGQWDFTHSRNLQKFLEVCQKVDMPVWLRIGPWAHGECRNGGFPDWLLKKGIALRTDDPVYLEYVQKFWQQLSHQAPAKVYLPDQKPSSPEDLTTLRASVRHHESGQGFLFINNHQRKRNLPAHQACTFTLQFDESELVLGPIDVLQEACMLIPYQLQMGKAKLLRTNASLLCRLGKRYFFYTDQRPFYELEKEEEEKGLSLITLSVGEANHAYKLGQRLYIADCPLIEKEGKIYALSTKQTQKIVYYEEHGEAKTCTLSFELPHLEVVVHEKQAFGESDEAVINTQKNRRYLIVFQNDFPPEAKDVFLDIAYKGDRAEVYQQGKLIADWYTTGAPWHLALKRYEYPRQIELVIYPSKEGVYFDLPVTQGCELEGITAFCEQIQEVTR